MSYLLLFLSYLGYINLMRLYLKVPVSFSWILVFLAQILCFFVGGLLGRLVPVMQVVYYGGWLCGLVVLVGLTVQGSGRLDLKHYRQDLPAELFLGLWLLIGCLALSGVVLRSYDNFSHWAVIVKYLYTQGHFPVASDQLISFNSYPPGSALFINYFVTMTHYSEGALLIGQWLLIGASLQALVGISRHRQLLSTILVLFFAMLFTTLPHTISPQSLLVDTLMPLIALAGMIAIYYYRCHVWAVCAVTILFSGVLLFIKNSAIFFVALLLMQGYLQIRPHRTGGERLWPWLTALIFSFLPLQLWRLHVAREFGTDMAAKHTMSWSHYLTVIQDKDWATIGAIAGRYVLRLLDPSYPIVWLGLAAILLFARSDQWFSRFLTEQTPFRRWGRRLAWICGLYLLGLLLMYFFSMPTVEALNLVSLERYAMSMFVGVFGLYMIVYLYHVHNHRQYSRQALGISLLVCLLMSGAYFYQLRQTEANYQTDAPRLFRDLVDEQFELSHQPILVAHAGRAPINNNYTTFFGRYYLMNDQLRAYSQMTEHPGKFMDVIRPYEYYLILEEGTVFADRVQAFFHQQLTPGLWRLEGDRFIEVAPDSAE